MAWQAGNAQGVFLSGSVIQVIMSLWNPDYTWPSWHTTLFAISMIFVAYVGNVWGHKVLHLWQNVVFTLHIMVFMALIVPIWVNAPLASSKSVWTDFSFYGGYSNVGLAALVGQQTGIFSQIGVDTVCAHHI